MVKDSGDSRYEKEHRTNGKVFPLRADGWDRVQYFVEDGHRGGMSRTMKWGSGGYFEGGD